MGVCGALFLRRAVTDHGPATQDRGAGVGLGPANGPVHCLRVMPVDFRDHVPAIGGKAPCRIIGEPAFGLAVDRDAVVVVEHDQFAQTERTGQAACLVRDPFHQASVPCEHVGSVIDHVVPVAVVAVAQQPFRQRHPDRIGQSLAQRAGRGFDPDVPIKLRMTGRARMQLAEGPKLFHR